MQGEHHGHIGQAGDSGVGQVATVALGRVTKGRSGRAHNEGADGVRADPGVGFCPCCVV